MVNKFALIRTPGIFFGTGQIEAIPGLLNKSGRQILILTGAKSYLQNIGVQKVFTLLTDSGFKVFHEMIEKEPSPADVDRIVLRYRDAGVDVVLAVGGGSVLDAGKAVSAMLPFQESVLHFLEGVGKSAHPGKKVFFMAMPTTAGTGSETTSNAVLAEVGAHGFKRSLRHENLVPDIALVDPSLTLGCPADITAASGMDAFTQLIESFLSVKASPPTDVLALEGITNIHRYLIRAVLQGDDMEARSGMAYAALLSGITLSNAGLGLIHGFASAIGGMFDAPHGAVCGSIMGTVNRYNLQVLLKQKVSSPAHKKYADLGRLFSGKDHKEKTWYMQYTAEYLEALTDKLKIPRLREWGMADSDLVRIAEIADHKANPVKFEKERLVEMLRERL